MARSAPHRLLQRVEIHRNGEVWSDALVTGEAAVEDRADQSVQPLDPALRNRPLVISSGRSRHRVNHLLELGAGLGIQVAGYVIAMTNPPEVEVVLLLGVNPVAIGSIGVDGVAKPIDCGLKLRGVAGFGNRQQENLVVTHDLRTQPPQTSGEDVHMRRTDPSILDRRLDFGELDQGGRGPTPRSRLGGGQPELATQPSSHRGTPVRAVSVAGLELGYCPSMERLQPIHLALDADQQLAHLIRRRIGQVKPARSADGVAKAARPSFIEHVFDLRKSIPTHARPIPREFTFDDHADYRNSRNKLAYEN